METICLVTWDRRAWCSWLFVCDWGSSGDRSDKANAQRRMNFKKINAWWEIMRESREARWCKDLRSKRKKWQMNCKSHINPQQSKKPLGDGDTGQIVHDKTRREEKNDAFLTGYSWLCFVLCPTKGIVKLWGNQDYTIQQLSQAPTVCRLIVGEWGTTFILHWKIQFICAFILWHVYGVRLDTYLSCILACREPNTHNTAVTALEGIYIKLSLPQLSVVGGEACKGRSHSQRRAAAFFYMYVWTVVHVVIWSIPSAKYWYALMWSSSLELIPIPATVCSYYFKESETSQ